MAKVLIPTPLRQYVDKRDSVELNGPLVIGHNCLIEKDVALAAGTVLGDNVVVSEGSSVGAEVVVCGTRV